MVVTSTEKVVICKLVVSIRLSCVLVIATDADVKSIWLLSSLPFSMTIVVTSDVFSVVIYSVGSAVVEDIVAGSIIWDVEGSEVVFGAVVVISGRVSD